MRVLAPFQGQQLARKREALLSFLCSLLIVAIPCNTRAQTNFNMKPATTVGHSLAANSKSLGSGINRWDFRVNQEGTRFEVSGLEFNLQQINSQLTLGLAPGGFWNKQSINTFSKDASQPLIVLQQAERNEPAFLFASSRVYHWPPTHGVFCLNAEGTATWVRPNEFQPGSIQLPDGKLVPFRTLNKKPATGTVCLLSGNIPLVSELKTWAETDVIACRLTPILKPNSPLAENVAIHLSLWAEQHEAGALPPGTANFLPGRIEPLEKLILSADDYAIIYLPADFPELHAALLANAPLSIHLPLPANVRFSQVSFETGIPLRENAVWLQELAKSPQGILAFDDRKQRLMVLNLGDLEKRLPWAILKDYVEKQNFGQVYSFSEDAAPYFLPDDERALSVAGGAFAVLYPEENLESLTIFGISGLQRLQASLAQGSNDSQPTRTPFALFDNRYTPERPLENYWSAPLETQKNQQSTSNLLPWLEVQLGVNSRLQFVDLHHAETVGFDPMYNLKRFRILGRHSATEPWMELLLVENPVPIRQQRLMIDSQESWESLRLEVLEPAFQPEVQVTRLAELIFWGTPMTSRSNFQSAKSPKNGRSK